MRTWTRWETSLVEIARWGYLAWVAFWLVALSLLAFATVVQGPVSF